MAAIINSGTRSRIKCCGKPTVIVGVWKRDGMVAGISVGGTLLWLACRTCRTLRLHRAGDNDESSDND